MFSKKKKKKEVELTPEQIREEKIKTYLDMNLPGMVKCNIDHIIQDSKYRAIWAIRAYPTRTADQALLRKLGEHAGVTLHVISDELSTAEEQKIVNNAANRTRMTANTASDVSSAIGATQEIADVNDLIRQLHRDKESLFKTSVFIEFSADSYDELTALEAEISSELKFLKINIDKLFLRQRQGFLSVIPGGSDQFKGEFSRCLPMSSVANLFPFSYSGKYDPHGFSIGKDSSGGQIIVDLDRRTSTITNSNVLILGQPGQGKSYAAKGMIVNLLELGKNVVIMDPEGEYEPLAHNLGGDYLDLMDGKWIINILEPKVFTTVDDGESVNDISNTTKTFTSKGALSQHISFLRDFFAMYKQLSRDQLDTLEIILTDLYASKGITNNTDMKSLPKTAFPIMTDLWDYINYVYENYDEKVAYFNKDTLRDLRLALQSICAGSQSRYFNGHTNVTNAHFLVFGMKGLLDADQALRSAMLFNVLSYMSDMILTQRNTAAIIDELYLFIGNGGTAGMMSCEYIRNLVKRSRKFDSMVIMATQNLTDLLRDDVLTYTKPLLEIPSHKFIFHLGQVDPGLICRNLQMEQNEFNVISTPLKGRCLYICGNERYSLKVAFPRWKSDMFGTAGGR